MSNVGRTLTVENVNPRILSMEYAVRGPIVIRATEIEKELSTVRLCHTRAFTPLSSTGCKEVVQFGDQGKHWRCARNGPASDYVHTTSDGVLCRADTHRFREVSERRV
jgi:hypothetical protein